MHGVGVSRLGGILPVRPSWASLVALSLLAVDCSSALAETRACPSGKVEVQASAAVDTGLICRASEQSVRFLGRCGISPLRPILISVHDEQISLWGIPIYGAFEVDRQIVHVATDLKSIELMMLDPDLSGLDLYAYFASAIAHEVSHAVVHQALNGRSLPWTSHEFIAFTTQIGTMPESLRKSITARVPYQGKVLPSHLRMPPLGQSPMAFGVLAYRYYTQWRNGCAFLNSVFLGRRRFNER